MRKASVASSAALDQWCRSCFSGEETLCAALVLERGISTEEAGKRAAARVLGGPKIEISHDANGAPYVAPGAEPILLSLTDEGGYAAGLAVRPKPGSGLCGVGVDLASRADFSDSPSNRRFSRKLFSEGELWSISAHPEEEQPLQAACIFSAKESALKSIAARLRLRPFCVGAPPCGRIVDFEMRPFGDMLEAVARGETATTVERLGITRIILSKTHVGDMALTVARAFEYGKDR